MPTNAVDVLRFVQKGHYLKQLNFSMFKPSTAFETEALKAGKVDTVVDNIQDDPVFF